MGHFLLRSLAVIGVLATPAQARDCSLALILALDVSGSVDANENLLHREGVATAILSESVIAAFLDRAPVALFVFEWSMTSHQEPLLPGWKIIASEADLIEVAAAIRASHAGEFARLNPSTAVGSALSFAAMALRDGPQCDAVTIDISGDGANNDGFSPLVAYATYPLDGVTVNALVIAGTDDVHPSWENGNVIAWFEAEVVRGQGAFAIIADGYSDYARAMEMKLLRELELPIVSQLVDGDGASLGKVVARTP